MNTENNNLGTYEQGKSQGKTTIAVYGTDYRGRKIQVKRKKEGREEWRIDANHFCTSQNEEEKERRREEEEDTKINENSLNSF